MSRRVILYADLATKTGWACWGPGRLLASGVWTLPKTGDDLAPYLRCAYDTFYTGIKAADVTLAAFESPIMPQSDKTTITTLRKVYGLAGVFELVCGDLGIDCFEAEYPTVAKHFTGNGGGTKKEKKARIFRECRERGFSPKDDNESDAIAGLDFTCHKLELEVPWPCGALFAEKTRS